MYPKSDKLTISPKTLQLQFPIKVTKKSILKSDFLWLKNRLETAFLVKFWVKKEQIIDDFWRNLIKNGVGNLQKTDNDLIKTGSELDTLYNIDFLSFFDVIYAKTRCFLLFLRPPLRNYDKNEDRNRRFPPNFRNEIEVEFKKHVKNWLFRLN